MNILKNLVYGSWWVGCCASALVMLSSCELGSDTVSFPLYVFVLGATLIVYNLNMLSGMKELRTSGTLSPRHLWCIGNEETLKADLGAGVLLAVPAFFMLHSSAWLLLMPLVGIAVLYVLPVLKGVKLREVGVWKIFLIATVWAAVTVVLPATQMEMRPETSEVIWLFSERWLFIFAITVPFDMRDLATDAKKGVMTLPSLLGWKQALALSLVALSVFAALASARLGVDDIWAYLPGILTATGLVIASRPDRSELFFSFWLEGTMMVLAVGAAISALVLA
ncbi:MAG: UbiA family prenyltransferase [Flavobacteriales bacterium]|nr:UbiA family prenyltransferase [Flavobacteriales bacterium]